MSRIAFLGLGRMGWPMAVNLVNAGHELVVWNRSPEKATNFANEYGETAASTPAEAANGADIVISMLANDEALIGAYRGGDGVIAALGAGTTVIDMGTVAPSTISDLATEIAAAGATLIDAPVSGSVAAATSAGLTIMAGGSVDAVERVRPVLEAMGKNVIHMGDSTRGSTMKLCVNAIVHSLNQAVSESLVLAERNGIDRLTAYRVFTESAIAAPFVLYRREAFERPGEIPVAFRLDLAAKDLELATALAVDSGTWLPQTDTNLAVLRDAGQAGYGDLDESGVAVYLRDREPGTGTN